MQTRLPVAPHRTRAAQPFSPVQGVDAVVSYDAPVYLKTYVHRVGRTARAGRAGQAFTLLRPQEVRHFKGMLSKADAGAVAARTVPPADMAAVAPACARALARVEAAVLSSKQPRATQKAAACVPPSGT